MARYREVLLVIFVCHTVFSKASNFQLIENNEVIDLGAEYVALLIEDSPRNFENALNFVQMDKLKNKDFWLITFNSSGVSSVWQKSSNNIENFYSTLQSLEAQSSKDYDISSNTSLSFFSVLHAAQILPKGGAIIVFSNSLSGMDTSLENLALNTVLSKNITVYTISDNRDAKDSLENLREYSGGKELKIDPIIKYEDYKQYNHNIIPMNMSVILSRRKLMNINRMTFPIDHDVTGIHISVTPSSTTVGELLSPSGYRFSFSSKAKSNPIRYSQGSVFENQDDFYEIHLNFSTSGRLTTGTWRLTLENFKNTYNVSVFAFTNIAARAQIDFTDNGINTNEASKDVMKLGVTGNISHITDISVLNRNGELVLSNITYNPNNDRSKYVTENDKETENKEVNVEINKLQCAEPLYALIRGKDVKGNIFQRLSYILGKSDIYPHQTITVEVGLGSEVIVMSGKKAEIYFEITNSGTSAQLVSFSCSDSRYILQSLSIYKRYLEPQESTIVILYLNARYGSYQDEITFTVNSGFNVVRKRVLVDVGVKTSDTTPPELDHRYTSDCTEVLFSECSKGTWTVEITTRDVDSGILQLNTIPKGLFFPYGYTVGTKDSVTGYYSDSCCNPKLQISAVDRMNNRRSYDINAYHARWSAGAIAALVLGLLLFIILVAVIVFFAVRKCKTKESYDLPAYRGGGI